MKKLFIYSAILFIVASCAMKTYKLQNGITKVPYDKKVYKNKSRFNKELLKIIDTAAVYEAYSEKYNILTRLDNHPENSFYGVYRFYANGCFNLFYFERDIIQKENDFNPNYRGYRGVYYKEGDEIKSDLFSIANDWGWTGKLNESLIFKGDTLYVKRDKSRGNIEKYVKRKLPAEYLKYKADW